MLGSRLWFRRQLFLGEAWAITRKLVAGSYHLETVVASHDAKRPSFSENADYSDILFIARKRDSAERAGRTIFINLWRNPRSIHEAIDLANRIGHLQDPVTIESVGLTTISGTGGKLGEIVSLPHADGEENWTGALFAQTELLRAYWSIHNGKIRIPGDPTIYELPTCRLDKLGALGYDRRDIHDAFEVSTHDWSPYPAFWSHMADKVRTISQKPMAQLLARTVPAKGRKLKSATAVWAKAGRILLAERLRTNTHRVIAVGFSKEVLGNTWWAFRTESSDRKQEKALLLWLNSSPSVLLYFGRRVITEGAWMQMKKPAWAAMPVLDVTALSENQISALAAAYDELASEQLEALAKLDYDPNRRRIDDAISAALDLPSLAPIRELLAREPGLTASNIAPRQTQAILDLDESEDENQGALI